MILTCRQTPFFCGQPCRAGCFGRRYCCTRGLRTSWLIVGMIASLLPEFPRPKASIGSSPLCYVVPRPRQRAEKCNTIRYPSIGQEDDRRRASGANLFFTPL